MSQKIIRDFAVETDFIVKSILAAEANLPPSPAVGDCYFCAVEHSVCLCIDPTPTWQKRILGVAHKGVHVFNQFNNQMLTWSGTALEPAVSGGGILSAEVLISAAEILNLEYEPKELIAAPGEGKFLEIVSVSLIFDVGEHEYYSYGESYLHIRHYDPYGYWVQMFASIKAAALLWGHYEDMLVYPRRIMPLGYYGLYPDEAIEMAHLNDASIVLMVTDGGIHGDYPEMLGVLRAKILYRIHDTGL